MSTRSLPTCARGANPNLDERFRMITLDEGQIQQHARIVARRRCTTGHRKEPQKRHILRADVRERLVTLQARVVLG